MFDKKYKKALEILDSEIEFNRTVFLNYSSLARTIDDEKTKQLHIEKAREYNERIIALLELKTKLYKEIEL